MTPARSHGSAAPGPTGAAGGALAGASPRGANLRDLLEGATIVGAAVVVWIAATALPSAPVEGELSSGTWPKALAIALAVLGIALVVEALRGRVKRDETIDPVNPAQWPVLAGTLAIVVAFLIAWPAVGFLASAIVCFVLLSRLLGVGNWIRSAVWGIGLALIMWILFEELLNIPL